jgi:hypothetical protein
VRLQSPVENLVRFGQDGAVDAVSGLHGFERQQHAPFDVHIEVRDRRGGKLAGGWR